MIWLIALFSLFARPAAADVIIPTTTTVYFEDQGQPINEPVDFTVSCYGYSYPPGEDPNYQPGEYQSVEVYSFNDTCASYGCTIDESYYLNYRHVDYCLVTGTIDGQQFSKNIGNLPYTTCQSKRGIEKCESRFDISGTGGTQVIPNSFWLAWLVTILVETVVLLFGIKIIFKKSAKLAIGQIIGLGMLLSSLTLPYVWFLFPWVPTIWLAILLKETVVVVIEAVLLKTIGRLTWRTSLVLSLMTNVASYLVGFIIVGYW